jgi:hypothetical protein
MAPAKSRKRGWYGAFLDAGIWVLFVALLLPAAAAYVTEQIAKE